LDERTGNYTEVPVVSFLEGWGMKNAASIAHNTGHFIYWGQTVSQTVDTILADLKKLGSCITAVSRYNFDTILIKPDCK
jgi:hypothetical protein